MPAPIVRRWAACSWTRTVQPPSARNDAAARPAKPAPATSAWRSGTAVAWRITLRSHWHPIATVEELTEQPRRVTLLGEHLALYRAERGPVVLKDLCIHRGAALSLGWVANGEITCAYHGWRYDRTGACVHIPSLPEGQPIPKRAR